MGGQLHGSLLRTLLWAGTLSGRPRPRICLESGTYQGDSTRLLAQLFETVHTIELSPKYFALASEKLRAVPGIHFYLGDSGSLMGDILAGIREPAVIFLDAHWAGGDTAHGADEVPLLRELQSISPRHYPDLLIIDDLRLVGRTGTSGTEGNSIYPKSSFDWRNVTMGKILQLAGHGIRHPRMVYRDRLFIFRNCSFFSGVSWATAGFLISSFYLVLRGCRDIFTSNARG